MTMRRLSKPAARLLAALLAPTILSGCVGTGSAPITRRLPAADLIVPAPAPRPAIREGDDVRLLARRALDYGDQNAARLQQARKAYEAVQKHYAASPPNP